MTTFCMVDEALSSASLARRLYDVALEAPGAAGFARMEKVRRASTYELCLLASEWGVDLEGPSSAAPAARAEAARPPAAAAPVARDDAEQSARDRGGAPSPARPEVDSPRATSFAPGLLRSQSERSTLESLTLGLARRHGRGQPAHPKARHALVAAKRAAEVIASMECASVDELIASAVDWRQMRA